MAEERKELITARDMLEAIKVRARPNIKVALEKVQQGETSGEGAKFLPTDVPSKIRLTPSKSSAHKSLTDKVWDFKFDPYLGETSWSETVEGVECRIILTLTEVDNWMFGFTQQTYTPPPGIRLIITKGARRHYGFGHRFNQSDVKVYIHRRSFRVELSKQYQEFGTLTDGAKTEGLAGVGFPVDWDEVPYDV
jgi:hypothetical protein